jgi:hypothetical protein
LIVGAVVSRSLSASLRWNIHVFCIYGSVPDVAKSLRLGHLNKEMPVSKAIAHNGRFINSMFWVDL